jgi:hypothetical protein
MIGVSIYGFVDYKKTSHRKEFTKMYATKEDPVVTPVKKNDVVVKNEPVAVEKVAVIEELPAKTEKIIEETKTVSSAASNENNSEKKFKQPKKKKLNYKLYSRAALEERYIDKELKTEEAAKIKTKAQ